MLPTVPDLAGKKKTGNERPGCDREATFWLPPNQPVTDPAVLVTDPTFLSDPVIPEVSAKKLPGLNE